MVSYRLFPGVLLLLLSVVPSIAAPPPLKGARLLDEVQHRAFRFFWENADSHTGLVNDRASNHGPDKHTVASTASTGYALAALPIAVERKWIPRAAAEARARLTLRYILDKMPHEHGWLTHFIDRRTAKRVWNSEVSSIDTSLFMLGALVAGRYFGGEVRVLAERLYARLDWEWMRTNSGAKPDKLLLSHGWKPESGFITTDWDTYSEGPLIYLLGMGAAKNPIPARSWDAWQRGVVRYKQFETLTGGPIFLHQMIHGYFDLRGTRDRLGYDYAAAGEAAMKLHRQYCIDLMPKRKTYGPNVWGLNACDGPKDYNAYGYPGPEDGTVSPTGALASVLFTPARAIAAGETIHRLYGAKLWGKYGFGNSLNVDANWYDPDVIGIDLGMALLAIENHRTGLIWKLMRSHPLTARAYRAAGLRVTKEQGPRPLRIPPASAKPGGRPLPYQDAAPSSEGHPTQAAPARLSRAQRITDPVSGVEIIWDVEPAMFPDFWRTKEINARAETLRSDEIARSVLAIRRALGRYPPSFLRKQLKRVYVVGKLSFSGIDAGGTNCPFPAQVYLANAGRTEGYSDGFLEESFHHEFSSVLLYNNDSLFPKAAWQRANPPGFQYIGDAVEAVRSSRSSLDVEERYLTRGFMSQYGMSDLEDDFNTIVEKLFAGGREFWSNVRRYPRLGKKVRHAIAFYHALHPAFTERYFRRLPGSSVELRATRAINGSVRGGQVSGPARELVGQASLPVR